MKQTFDIQFSVGQRWARAFISCCAIAITLRAIAIMLCAMPITLRAIALIKKNESLTCYAHAQVGGILFHLSLYTLHIAWRSNHI